MNISKITTKIGNTAGSVRDKIGSKIVSSNGALDKFIKKIEPTGGNNAFIGMATLMGTMVIFPRVRTAARRNPNDKEATKDEITEILFRDLQTVGIILFALKAMNSLVARGASKLTGLPMTNKPYQKLFNTDLEGFEGIKAKGKELIEHPVQKLKIIGKNILDTINPIGGVVMKTNEDFISDYSGFPSTKDIYKKFINIKENNGDPEKTFGTVMKNVIEKQNKVVEDLDEEISSIKDIGLTLKRNSAQAILDKLEDAKKQGYECLNNDDLDEFVKDKIVRFFKDKNNALVYKGKILGATLRTVALAIESAYLGFGLPALNQRRLEKKYLRDNKNAIPNNNKKSVEIKELTEKPIRNVSAKNNSNSEKQIFQKFLK